MQGIACSIIECSAFPKRARENQNVTYKGTPIRISADFSTETLQARREWQEIFKVLKGKNNVMGGAASGIRPEDYLTMA